ncbi:MAG: NADH-quinone oxidoreductase subunit N [Methylacidiphilales bacterium]|nr:NADH-quinone oxidoreductase subunit N [Candidatus Methylacidiphilales bacterium]
MKLLLMPEFQLLLWAVLLLIFEAYRPQTSAKVIARLAIFGAALVFAGLFCPKLNLDAGYSWEGLYKLDSLAVFFKGFFLLTLIVVLWMSGEFVEELPLARNEFLILPLFPTVGMMLLASAVDFMTVFVAIELVTISFYILVAYQRNNAASLEAGAKYLVIGALSTGFLVYGIAFLYGSVGSTAFSDILGALAVSGKSINPGLLFAMVLIVTGLAFKVSAVPFHVWAPDVYQGAPTPVTAFLAVGSKAAGFAVLLRILDLDGFSHAALVPYSSSLLVVLAGATVVLGNFAALPQRNIKRLLAYSSIGHAGFMLMALSCHTVRGVEAVLIYLVIYMLAALLAFFVITLVSRQVGGDELSNYSGLSQRSPLAAFALLVAFVSMAGIPPLAGFLGKLAVFAAVWETRRYFLLALGIISAAAGLYYYLGVVRSMYWNEPTREAPAVELSFSSQILVWFLTLALIILGFSQIPLVVIIRQALGGLRHG